MQTPSKQSKSISSSSSSSSSSKHGDDHGRSGNRNNTGFDEGMHSSNPTQNLISTIGSSGEKRRGYDYSPGKLSPQMPRLMSSLTVGGRGDGASGAGGLLTLYSPGSSSTKRRKIDHSAESSSGEKARRRTDLIDPPPGPPMCYECKKQFPSWKAVFGHLRSHPNRSYRGFLPPPAFASTEIPPLQAVQGSSVGRDDMVLRSNEEEAAAMAREPWIDLNDEPVEESEDGSGGIDLNKPPSKHEDTNKK